LCTRELERINRGLSVTVITLAGERLDKPSKRLLIFYFLLGVLVFVFVPVVPMGISCGGCPHIAEANLYGSPSYFLTGIGGFFVHEIYFHYSAYHFSFHPTSITDLQRIVSRIDNMN